MPTRNLTEQEKQFVLGGGVLSDPQTQQSYADFVRANQAGGQTITTDSLALVPSVPFQPQPTDTNNYQGIISGGQTLADFFKNTSVTPEQPKDLNTMFDKLYTDLGIQGKETKAAESAKSLDILNAQMAALSAEAQAVPIQVAQESEGRGRTLRAVQGINEQRLREIALKSLPLQGQILAQQAVTTGDQRALEASMGKFRLSFDIQQKNEQQQYEYKKENRKAIYDFLTAEQKVRADAKQKQEDRDFTTMQNNLNQAQDLTKKALDAGQADVAAKITSLDPKSKTYQTDLASLAGQIQQSPKEKLEIQKLQQDLAGGGGTVDMAGLPNQFVNAVNQGKTGNDILNSLTPIDKATLQSILDYEKNPANLSLRKVKGESRSEREKFLGMAHLIDPSYDESQYANRSTVRKDFNSGKSAQNIRSLNTAVGHLDTLSKTGDKLANASLPLWNKIANSTLSAIGDSRVVAFNTAATAVESELASVFKGMGATDQEIKVWRENINSSQSPEQLKGAIDTAIELMGSRLQALTNQYELGVGKPKDFKILSDKSRQILSNLGVDVEALDPIKTPAQGTAGTPDQQIVNGVTYEKAADGLYYPKQ